MPEGHSDAVGAQRRCAPTWEHLLFDELADCFELSGAAEFLVFVGNELASSVMKILPGGRRSNSPGYRGRIRDAHGPARRPSVSMFILVTPSLAAGIVFILVHTLGALQGAAGRVDAGHFFLRDGAGTVHHQREARQALLDLHQNLKVQSLRTGELEGSVAGADGAGRRGRAGAFHEFLA